MAGLSPFRVCFDRFLWRAVDDDDADLRVLEGVASSAAPDLAGDVLEPKGAAFDLPMPLLMQHDRDRPVGDVLAAKVTDSEIRVRAELKKGTGLAYVEDAWRQLKAGLVKGFSIGAQPLKAEPILNKDGRMTGVRYTAWRWLETSAVTLPMNPRAGIDVVRMLGPWGATVLTPRDPLSDMEGAESERQSYEATRARAQAALAAARVALHRRDSP